MKVETKNNEIVLKDVFNGIGLETRTGETFGICMRNSGFEFIYANKKYEANEGVLREMKSVDTEMGSNPTSAA